MKSKMIITSLIVVLVVLLNNCGDREVPEVVSKPVSEPEGGEIYFYADRNMIEAGQCTFLRWEVVGGIGANLDGDDVPLASETEVCPAETQVYELTVDMGDHVEARTIEVAVTAEMEKDPTRGLETATPSQPKQEQDDIPPPEPAYQADVWTRLGGPPGALGYDIRMDPRNPDVMFVTASPGGIFKSVDGGQTWVAKNQGLEKYPGSGADIFCATIDPHNPDHIWIGTQFTGHVFRSTDGGETWHQRDNGITQMAGENSIRGIAIDPNNPDTVYVGMERGTGIGGVTGEVYKSTDGGESFTMIWQGENLARYIWVDPKDSQRLYVSTGIFDRDAANSEPDNMVCGGVGIVRSEDGGSTWTVLDRDNGLNGTYIPSLYLHPTNPEILLAAVTVNSYCLDVKPGVYVTRDGGDSWTLSLPAFAMEAVEISETDPEVWYAATNGIFWRSDDGGQNWQEYPLRTVHRKSGTPIDLQADPRDPLRIFVNNYEGGNFLSEDGGGSWVDASSGYTGARITGLAVAPGNGSTLLAAAEASTFRSTDGGKHWIGAGIDGPAAAIHRYTTSTGNAGLIASGSWGDHRVYFSSDGGQSWQESQVTSPEAIQVPGFMMARALVVAPSDPQVIYIGYGSGPCLGADWPFCVDPAPGFFRSSDGGKSWKQATGTPFEGASILSAAVPVDDAKTVFLATMDGLYVSHDSGDKWEPITSLEKQVPWREMGGVQIPPALVVVADPFDGQTLFVGTQGMGLWLSSDGGVSWTQASAGMEPNEFVMDILPDPNHPGVIYAATEQSGVYISKDGAATWHKLTQGLDFRAIRVLALSEDGSILYAGSGGAGVFRLGNPGEMGSSTVETPSPVEPAVTQAPIPNKGQVTIEKDLEYTTYALNGQENSLLLDLHLPASDGPVPLLLFLHGGGWFEGSKDDCPGEVFAQNGYATACINYRLAETSQGCFSELTFPIQIHDVKAAVRWLRSNADTYGLDPARFAAIGDSSGGHLAALLGVSNGVEALQGTQNLGVSDEVQAVVDWFGPVDVNQSPPEILFTDDPCVYDFMELSEKYGGEATPYFYWTFAWAALLGGPLNEVNILQQAQLASPLTHVDSQDPPFLIMHGEADGMIPINQSELLADALRAAEVEVSFVPLPGIGHGYYPPNGRQKVLPEFLQPTLQFLDQYLNN